MSYFKSDQKFIYLEKQYCEFYIPISYFEGAAGFAEDQGEIIKALGVFDVGFFENGKLVEFKVLNVPTWIELYVYDHEVKSVKLPGEENSIVCKVLKYFKGNKIMNSTIVEDSSNAELYLKFITQGKLPSAIPYNKSLAIWRKNQSLNGTHLGVPSVIEELILSVAYRDKANPSQKFSSVIGKDPNNVSQYDYKMASIRQICQYASTFTALTFEDIDSMITTSLNRTREKKPEAESPIEKIMKM